MELFLFRQADYRRLYSSCVNISVDAIPLSERRQPVNGWLTLCLYAVLEVGG
jgi:hypothetical protein